MRKYILLFATLLLLFSGMVVSNDVTTNEKTTATAKVEITRGHIRADSGQISWEILVPAVTACSSSTYSAYGSAGEFLVGESNSPNYSMKQGFMELSVSCCNGDGMRGNVDGIAGPGGHIDVADLSFIVDYLFKGGPVPPCIDEGNVDGIEGPGGPIDVADLSYLVDYLFKGGDSPPPCP
jgi:hypothetical protein